MRKLIALTGLSLLIPFAVQAKTLEDILVEKGIITRNELALTQEESAEQPVKIYWNEGSRIEFPDDGFTTRIYTEFKTRYEFVDKQHEPNVDNFKNTNLRIGIDGTALYNEFYYKFEADLQGDAGDLVRDGYIQWQPCDNIHARLGQWKTELSRQFNTGITKMQFLDDTAASNLMHRGYQQGFGVGGDVLDGKVKLGASIRGGDSYDEGRNKPGMDNDVAGFGYIRADILGEMDPFEEGDLANTEELALNVGAAYGYSDFNAIEQNMRSQGVTADANLKYKGLSIAGEYLFDNLDPKLEDKDINYNAFYVQSGYFILPQQLELAGRFGYSDCDNGRYWGECSGKDNIKQAGAVVNYYFWGQHLKAQLGYDVIKAKEYGTNEKDTINKYMVGVSTWW